jgi:hypothetical protein
MLKINYAAPLVAFVLFLGACSGSEEKEKTTTEISEDVESSDEVDYVLPQPISLAKAFNSAGLTYVSGKANPTSKEKSYTLKIDQLLNLGVYSTDLAYCAINNKPQEARQYLMVVQSLGSKVGLESVFSNKELIAKFDKNLGNQEELENLIYDIQDRSDAYMEDNDLKYLGGIHFAGAWIEGMYLGIEDSKKKEDIGKALVDQMALLKNILKGFKSHPAQEDIRLKEIIKLYEGILNTYEGFDSVKKNADNINVQAPELSEEEFDRLSNEIRKVRENVVKPGK